MSLEIWEPLNNIYVIETLQTAHSTQSFSAEENIADPCFHEDYLANRNFHVKQSISFELLTLMCVTAYSILQ